MTDTEEEIETVFSFRKNALEEVRASVKHWKGRDLLDLRAYFQGDDGQFHPSRKGLTLQLDRLADLERAVKKLREKLGTEVNT